MIEKFHDAKTVMALYYHSHQQEAERIKEEFKKWNCWMHNFDNNNR